MTALNAEQFLSEVDSFPIDIKTKLVDKLLHSLHPISDEIDALWRDEIELRVDEIKTGKVTLVDGEEVFARVRSKFQK